MRDRRRRMMRNLKWIRYDLSGARYRLASVVIAGFASSATGRLRRYRMPSAWPQSRRRTVSSAVRAATMYQVQGTESSLSVYNAPTLAA